MLPFKYYSTYRNWRVIFTGSFFTWSFYWLIFIWSFLPDHFHRVATICKGKVYYCFRDTTDDDNEDDDETFEQVSSFKGVAKSFKLNFAPGIRNLHERFQRAIIEAGNELTTQQRTGRALKYYLTLRCHFYKPTDPDTTTDDPCIFNSETCTLLPSTSIKSHIEINCINIMQAVENYETNGSGKNFCNFL